MPRQLRASILTPLYRTLIGAVILATSIVASACIAEDDLTFDQRHRQLSEQLMCPVCDGQTIDQSSAAISEDMKSVIWQQLENGRSNAQIRDYFVARYGEAVLAAPTSAGINVTAWVLPAVIAAIGLAVVGSAYIRMRVPRTGNALVDRSAVSPQSGSDSDDDVLDSYLERIDAELESSNRESPR